MGSGSSYDDYEEKAKEYEGTVSADPAVKARAEYARKGRLDEARAKVREPGAPSPAAPKRDVSELIDPNLVRSQMTRPAEGVTRVHYVLIDNSGSNRAIATHLRDTSGYLLATMKSLDPVAQLAFDFFSDHCDGAGIMQYVDWVTPDAIGDRTLFSSAQQVLPMGGGDAPEAIECALHHAASLDFGEAKERHLYLVTDVVAHGMGMSGDDGCPKGRDWAAELERARGVFTSISVVGCGTDAKTGELQRKFVKPERLAFDFVDLSGIPQQAYRLGIVGNAILFLIARNRDAGSQSRNLQTVELFLSMLYEKWLIEPMFGANTDLAARPAIERFFKYLDASPEDVAAMRARIFAD